MGTRKKYDMIMAIDRKGALGRDNDLIIRSKEDMDFFKNRTAGHSTIMGFKTWLSIGEKPLPNRPAIVVCREPKAQYEKYGNVAFFVSTVEVALLTANKINLPAMVIGGASLYNKMHADAERIWVTAWDTVIEGADTFIEENIYLGRKGQTIGVFRHKDGYSGSVRVYVNAVEGHFADIEGI